MPHKYPVKLNQMRPQKALAHFGQVFLPDRAMFTGGLVCAFPGYGSRFTFTHSSLPNPPGFVPQYWNLLLDAPSMGTRRGLYHVEIPDLEVSWAFEFARDSGAPRAPLLVAIPSATLFENHPVPAHTNVGASVTCDVPGSVVGCIHALPLDTALINARGEQESKCARCGAPFIMWHHALCPMCATSEGLHASTCACSLCGI